jgi:hypothetical protein
VTKNLDNQEARITSTQIFVPVLEIQVPQTEISGHNKDLYRIPTALTVHTQVTEVHPQDLKEVLTKTHSTEYNNV